MKRSEMVELIARRLTPVGISYPTCEEVLEIIEKAGMLPPCKPSQANEYDEGKTQDITTLACEWEPEAGNIQCDGPVPDVIPLTPSSEDDYAKFVKGMERKVGMSPILAAPYGTVPSDEIHFRDPKTGALVGKIVNVTPTSEGGNSDD